MKGALQLWKYNLVTGLWNQERLVTSETAMDWLAAFHRHMRKDTFTVSDRRPSTAPKDHVPRRGETMIFARGDRFVVVERSPVNGKFFFTNEYQYQRGASTPKEAKEYLAFFDRWRRLPSSTARGPWEDPGGE